MSAKEATARIKINHLLEAAGRRFFDDSNGPAKICLEPRVKDTSADLDELGENCEKTTNGFSDFLDKSRNGGARKGKVLLVNAGQIFEKGDPKDFIPEGGLERIAA